MLLRMLEMTSKNLKPAKNDLKSEVSTKYSPTDSKLLITSP